MDDSDLEKYRFRAVEGFPAEAKVIPPKSVVTAPWVRLKCQYGCPEYGKGYCCPPDTPTADQTRVILDSYRRAILYHIEGAKREGRNRREFLGSFFERLVDIEAEMFKDGYYRAFVFLAGPCNLCRTCGKLEGEPCRFRSRARPAMEASGIDVYETARENGFPIHPLREKGETQNVYCLMLVD